MSYSQLNADADLTKAVISVFFRIPSATADAVRYPLEGIGGAFPNNAFAMQNFVPLTSFGPQQIITDHNVTTEHVLIDEVGAPGVELSFFNGSTTQYNIGPTFISVYFGGDDGLFTDGSVVVSVQASDSTSLSGVYIEITNAAFDSGTGVTLTTADGSSFLQNPDRFFGFSSDPNGSSPWLVTTDRWHHLLISWDVSNGCASHGGVNPFPDENFIDSVSKMWVAFDDVNRIQGDLPSTWANSVSDIAGWGENDIVSYAVGKCAGTHENFGHGRPTASLSVSGIPSNPINIPGPPSQTYSNGSGSETTVNPVQQVDMAELQVFTGVTLDTGIEANRRAFIKADGSPANPAAAQALLGKRPDILLSTFKKWKAGTNAGTLGPFTSTGIIKAYSKPPRLGT